MKIIIVEGVDGSGKSTVIRELRKKLAGKYQPLFVDRFLHSNYVYETLKSTVNINDLKDTFNKLIQCLDVIVIYLDVSPEVAIKRISEKNEPCTIEYIINCEILFEEAFKLLPINMHRINANNSLSEIVSQVLGVINNA